jgi:hypothetical protein
VPKTDTQETENLDKATSFDQKDVSRYLLHLSRHACTKWPYLPLTQDLSRSKVHNLPQLAKRLGGWVRAYSLMGNEWSSIGIQKNKQGLFKYASHLEEILSNQGGEQIL